MVSKPRMTLYKSSTIRKFQTTFSIHFPQSKKLYLSPINPLSPQLNPICYLLALLAHDFLHVTRIRVKLLTLRILMSYMYMEHLFLMFLDHTRRRTTVGRTPLDEWSARRRDLYLTTHDTHNRKNIRSPTEIVVSNPTGGMDICLLWVSCVVR
jgi:hypothetical protein